MMNYHQAGFHPRPYDLSEESRPLSSLKPRTTSPPFSEIFEQTFGHTLVLAIKRPLSWIEWIEADLLALRYCSAAQLGSYKAVWLLILSLGIYDGFHDSGVIPESFHG